MEQFRGKRADDTRVEVSFSGGGGKLITDGGKEWFIAGKAAVSHSFIAFGSMIAGLRFLRNPDALSCVDD